MNSHNHPQHDRTDRESLSALFDGELQGDAARFALKRLGEDVQWRRACGTWQLAGDVLRGQATAAAPRDFADRVQAALASESSAPARMDVTATTRIPRRRWVGGAALAASVAVAALFVARPFDEPAPAAQIATVANPPAPPTAIAAPAPSSPEATPAASASPQLDIGLAAATVAAVEMPRQASERRARGQSPRAASRASRPIETSVITPATALASTAADEAAPIHPFRPPPAQIASKPWPRAVLPNFPATGAFTASYGSGAGSSGISQPGSPSFYPFEPQLPQGIDAATGSNAQQP